MKKGNEWIKFSVKLIVGAGLVYYVLSSRMVDFATLKSVLSNPINLIVSFVFLAFSALCCAARWFLLVRAQGLALSFKNLVELTMIGNFFNTFMPGSVGGDLIKAWYVAGQEPQRKTRAIFTVLLDRVIGLAVIVFYAGATLLFYTGLLDDKKELQAVAYSLWAFTTVSFIFALVFFTPSLWNWEITGRFLGYLRKSKRLSQIIDAGLLYRSHLGRMSIAVGLSALSIFGTNVLFSIQGRTLGIPLELSHYFFIVPIGLTVSAIPLLPGGIGVGQVAFFKIFQWVGVANPEQGATLCTLMQVYTILFNCIGAIFYLKFKRNPQEKTVPDLIPMEPAKHASPSL